MSRGVRGTLTRLLVARFGDLPSSITERIGAATTESLDRWFDRAIHASTLDEVFAD